MRRKTSTRAIRTSKVQDVVDYTAWNLAGSKAFENIHSRLILSTDLSRLYEMVSYTDVTLTSLRLAMFAIPPTLDVDNKRCCCRLPTAPNVLRRQKKHMDHVPILVLMLARNVCRESVVSNVSNCHRANNGAMSQATTCTHSPQDTQFFSNINIHQIAPSSLIPHSSKHPRNQSFPDTSTTLTIIPHAALVPITLYHNHLLRITLPQH